MTESEVQKPILLAVLAHPDDETFGVGGTLALYARRGVEVHLICATRGEAGEVDPSYLDQRHTISEVREGELCCAARFLGLAGVLFLGYRDSGMPGSPDNQNPDALIQAPLEAVAEKIADHLRNIKPQVVITFDPIGGYRHPDHIAIHQATVLAFQQVRQEKINDPTAYAPAKLYYHNMPRTYLRLAVALMRLFGKDPEHFGKNGDINLAEIANVHFPTHAVINYRQVSRQRAEAFACHASQGGQNFNRGFNRWWQGMRTIDTFTRAYPLPYPKRKERDLFDGISFNGTK